MQISISFTIYNAMYEKNLVTPTDNEIRHQIQILKTPWTLSTVNTRIQTLKPGGMWVVLKTYTKDTANTTDTTQTLDIPDIQGHYRHQEQ